MLGYAPHFVKLGYKNDIYNFHILLFVSNFVEYLFQKSIPNNL